MSNQNNAPSADKLKALQLAMDKIEKDHGKGTIMKLGDDNIEDVSVIPSGSIGLNAALGVGGYPRGRIIEILAALGWVVYPRGIIRSLSAP